jgi:hypothetical protein
MIQKYYITATNQSSNHVNNDQTGGKWSDLVIYDGHSRLGGFLVHHLSDYLGIHSKLQTYGNEKEFDSVYECMDMDSSFT